MLLLAPGLFQDGHGICKPVAAIGCWAILLSRLTNFFPEEGKEREGCGGSEWQEGELWASRSLASAGLLAGLQACRFAGSQATREIVTRRQSHRAPKRKKAGGKQGRMIERGCGWGDPSLALPGRQAQAKEPTTPPFSLFLAGMQGCS